MQRIGYCGILRFRRRLHAQSPSGRHHSRHRRQFRPRRVRSVFRRHPEGQRGDRKVPAPPRAGADRQADRHPPQPRHALFVCRVRSRCRTGDDHAAGCRQAFHVDAGHQRGSLRAGGRLRHRQLHVDQGARSARAMWPSAIRTLVDPADPKDVEQVHALQDAIKVEPDGRRQIRGAELGSGQPEEGARCAAGACARRIPDFKKAFGTKDQVDPVRHLIGTAAGLGWQSGQGRHLSQHHAGEE